MVLLGTDQCWCVHEFTGREWFWPSSHWRNQWW